MSFFLNVKLGCGICFSAFGLQLFLLTSWFTAVRMVRISSPLQKHRYIFVLGRQLTSEKLPHFHISWSIPVLMAPVLNTLTKQLAKLLWTICIVLLCPTLLFFTLRAHSLCVSSTSAPKSNFCHSEGKYRCCQKETYGNIVTEDSCTPSAGTMPVCTRSPALGFCRKRNLAG